MHTRLLELALETLEKKKAGIEAEIEEIQAQLKGGIPGTSSTSEEKSKRLSRAMKAAWKKRKSGAKGPVAKPGPWTDEARKAVSRRMKAYWAKRKGKGKR